MSALAAPGPRMRVAVTGASGFIGRHLCARLAADGHAVRAVVRRPTPPGAGSAWPAGVEECVGGDLDDAGALERAFDGCDAVVHLAGRAHVLRERALDPAAEFRRVNADGAAAAFDAAAAAGARTFVLLSSVGAVAGAGGGRLDEATPPRPATPYGASKLAAEGRVLAAAAAAGVRAVALRPPMVHGPGMRGNPLRLFRLVERGVPLPLGAARNRRSVLSVANLAGAVAAALAAPAVTSGAYFVADDEAPSTAEFVRRAARALGRPARLVPVAPALLRLLGAVGDRLAPALPMPLTSATLDSLLGTLVVDDAPFRARSGWRPAQSLDAALAEAAAWYLAEHGTGTAGAPLVAGAPTPAR